MLVKCLPRSANFSLKTSILENPLDPLDVIGVAALAHVFVLASIAFVFGLASLAISFDLAALAIFDLAALAIFDLAALAICFPFPKTDLGTTFFEGMVECSVAKYANNSIPFLKNESQMKAFVFHNITEINLEDNH